MISLYNFRMYIYFLLLIMLFNPPIKAQITCFVTATNGLIVRAQADIKSPRVHKLKKGTKIKLLEKTSSVLVLEDGPQIMRGNWIKIEDPLTSITGYVFDAYVLYVQFDSTTESTCLKQNNFEACIEYSDSICFYQAPSLPNKVHLSKDSCQKLGILNRDNPIKIALKSLKRRLLIESSRTNPKNLDEQFLGYDFKYYNSEFDFYVLWESWYEAGKPLLVNTNQHLFSIHGVKMAYQTGASIFVSYAYDLYAGWTPNGIDFLKKTKQGIVKLMEINPEQISKKPWGPLEIRWLNDFSCIVQTLSSSSDRPVYKKIIISEIPTPPIKP